MEIAEGSAVVCAEAGKVSVAAMDRNGAAGRGSGKARTHSTRINRMWGFFTAAFASTAENTPRQHNKPISFIVGGYDYLCKGRMFTRKHSRYE